jgi:hypothetical protein
VFARQEKNIEDLTASLRSFTNSFTEESSDLFNLVTKVVMREKVKKDLWEQSEIGCKLFDAFVKERIKSGKNGVVAHEEA